MMKDTLAHIASIMNYAGFRTTELKRDTPEADTSAETSADASEGWFRRGMGGMFVFVTTGGDRLIAELYDAQGHCLSREHCDDALRAADTAEFMLHSCVSH